MRRMINSLCAARSSLPTALKRLPVTPLHSKFRQKRPQLVSCALGGHTAPDCLEEECCSVGDAEPRALHGCGVSKLSLGANPDAQASNCSRQLPGKVGRRAVCSFENVVLADVSPCFQNQDTRMEGLEDFVAAGRHLAAILVDPSVTWNDVQQRYVPYRAVPTTRYELLDFVVCLDRSLYRNQS